MMYNNYMIKSLPYLGAFLRDARKRRGLTLAIVYKSTGIGIDRLSNIENAKSNPNFNDVILLLNFYNAKLTVNCAK